MGVAEVAVVFVYLIFFKEGVVDLSLPDLGVNYISTASWLSASDYQEGCCEEHRRQPRKHCKP
jgi:hypothetical protein